MIKDKIIKYIYPLIEMLPARFAEKIKMTGCIWSGDWHMTQPNRAAFPPECFSCVTEEEIKRVYNGISDKEIKKIIEYLRCIRECGEYPFPENCFFYNYSKMFRSHDEYIENKFFRQEKIKDVKKTVRRFHLKWYDSFENEYSVFYFHHGLRLAQKSIHQYIRNSIFIDAGAFRADSALIFLSLYSPEKVFSFEPSKKSAMLSEDKLLRNYPDRTRWEVIRCGLSDVNTYTYFQDTGNAGTSIEHNQGDDKVQLQTLDSFMKEKGGRIGLIKADVEGMCFNVIKGAIETIKRDRPVLSLSIYHNGEEMTKVYPFLRKYLPDYTYRIFFLCPPHEKYELTIFAYPNNLNA